MILYDFDENILTEQYEACTKSCTSNSSFMSYTISFIFERASSNQHLMAQRFKAASFSGKQTTLSFGFDSISLYMAVWHQYALNVIIIEDLSIFSCDH